MSNLKLQWRQNLKISTSSIWFGRVYQLSKLYRRSQLCFSRRQIITQAACFSKKRHAINWALPPNDFWLENHFSLTSSPYASNTGFTAYLLRKFGNFEDLEDDKTSWAYLISERERQHEELIAILKSSNPSLDVKKINVAEGNIFSVLTNSCSFCCLVLTFSNVEETEQHNLEEHYYFCDHQACYCYKHRFRSEEILVKRKAAQTAGSCSFQ